MKILDCMKFTKYVLEHALLQIVFRPHILQTLEKNLSVSSEFSWSRKHLFWEVVNFSEKKTNTTQKSSDEIFFLNHWMCVFWIVINRFFRIKLPLFWFYLFDHRSGVIPCPRFSVSCREFHCMIKKLSIISKSSSPVCSSIHAKRLLLWNSTF